MKNTRLAQMLGNSQMRSGLTEAEIGERHGFSQQAFSTWKAGTVPRQKMYAAIASFLQISVEQLAELVEEAKVSSGNTRLPDMGAPVMGRGSPEAVKVDQFASGYAKPAVDGTYAVRIEGKNVWISPHLPPSYGNEVLIRAGSTGRLGIWPTELRDGEEVHTVVLKEMV